MRCGMPSAPCLVRAAWLVPAIVLLVGAALAAEPALLFKVSGRVTATLTLSQLEAKVTPTTVTYFDPYYHKNKSFRCLPMAQVMRAGFGDAWLDGVHTDAVLTALDGYASQSTAAKLAEQGGCLAFQDVEVPGWEPIGHAQVSPAPFYLFWTAPTQGPQHEYPWPWQLASIDLVQFEEAYPQVVPTGAPEDSAAARGFKIFKGRCLRCHAMNQQGGKIGPDLNAPQSIVQYRSKEWLASWTRQPSQYRYTHMPDHLDLTDQNLDDLYEYFRWKSQQPEKKP